MDEIKSWRVNVEVRFLSDPHFAILVNVLGGNRDLAIGKCVGAWFLAQPYWAKERSLIPPELFEAAGYGCLVTCGLAELQSGGVYVKGIMEQFAWIEDRRKAGAESAKKRGSGTGYGARGTGGRFVKRSGDGTAAEREPNGTERRSVETVISTEQEPNGTEPLSSPLSSLSSKLSSSSRGASPPPATAEVVYEPDQASGRQKQAKDRRKPPKDGAGLPLDPKTIPGVVSGDEAGSAFKDLCRQTWAAYAEAYGRRYRDKQRQPIVPTRAARENSLIIGFCKRFGAESPDILAYYVSMNKPYYVSNAHELSLGVRDGQGIRTQMLAGRNISQREAKQAEGDDVFDRFLKNQEAQGGNG